MSEQQHTPFPAIDAARGLDLKPCPRATDEACPACHNTGQALGGEDCDDCQGTGHRLVYADET